MSERVLALDVLGKLKAEEIDGKVVEEAKAKQVELTRQQTRSKRNKTNWRRRSHKKAERATITRSASTLIELFRLFVTSVEKI